MLRKTITGLFATGLAFAGLAGTAGAANAAPAPQVKAVTPVVQITGSSTARIHGVYKCYGNMQAHLWVSAKQGSTSGAAATAWWDTNYNSDPNTGQPLQTANCDGKVHSVWVTIKPTPFFPTGTLKNHTKTYIQFCIVQGNDELSAIVSSKMFWGRTVKLG